MTNPSPARVRFAPSPTGRFHIGGARTALYDYLIARQTGGQFVLRIEDTDQKRFVPEAEAEIMAALRWLGLEWDEGPDIDGSYGPYRQSERREIYQEHAAQLVRDGYAYPCFCTPERLAQVRKAQQAQKQPPRYDRQCRNLSPEEASVRQTGGEAHTIRFRTPLEGSTIAVDAIRGEIKVENSQLDDYILMKSDGLPVYHLAVVIDDHLMGITHAIRSSEWLPTLPLHVLLYQAFGWDQPVWIHPSVFLNPSGKGKMSKRYAEQEGGGSHSIYTLEFQELGYLPEAVVNWLALMGWAYDDRTEFFTLDDLVEKFSIEKLNASPAAVNFSKLDHFNGLHIRALEPSDLQARLLPYFEGAGYRVEDGLLAQIVPLIQERIKTLDEAVDMAGFFFERYVQPNAADLVGKNLSAPESAALLRRSHAVIQGLTNYADQDLEEELRRLAEEMGLKAGQLFGVLRMAITGQQVSPPLIETMIILGKETVLARIDNAVKILETAD